MSPNCCIFYTFLLPHCSDIVCRVTCIKLKLYCRHFYCCSCCLNLLSVIAGSQLCGTGHGRGDTGYQLAGGTGTQEVMMSSVHVLHKISIYYCESLRVRQSTTAALHHAKRPSGTKTVAYCGVLIPWRDLGGQQNGSKWESNNCPYPTNKLPHSMSYSRTLLE